MLTKFSPASAYAITRPVSSRMLPAPRGLVHIGDVIRAYSLDKRDRFEMIQRNHERSIEEINQARAQVQSNPDNYSLIYELCKRVYELAELERVNFNGAEFMEKYKFIMQLVPFADRIAIAEGVSEYHESRINLNWMMQFLSDDPEQNGSSSVFA